MLSSGLKHSFLMLGPMHAGRTHHAGAALARARAVSSPSGGVHADGSLNDDDVSVKRCWPPGQLAFPDMCAMATSLGKW